MYKGIDVSSIQGIVDWNWCVQQGISFVICRCGLGSNQHDPNYTQNILGAKAAGLKVAAYHVIYPYPADNPETIAEYHHSLAGGELALSDLEWPYPNTWASHGMSAAQVRDWSDRYHAKYSELDGRQMLIYSYPSFLQACAFQPSNYTATCRLWIASYTAKPAIPSPWNDWALWQYAGGTAMKLPNGSAVDTDYAPDLTLWDASTPVAPSPAPGSDPAPPVNVEPTDPIQQPAPPPPPPVPVGGNVWTFITNLVSSFFKR